MAEHERIPRNGLSIRELAKRIGRSQSTVARYTSEPREVYLARVSERHQRILELREEGMTMAAIASELGITPGAVHYALNKQKKPE